MSKPTTEELVLIRSGRSKFVSLAASYFLGVFNDNFFKQAALLIAVALGDPSFQGFATVLFALPFILFAAPAGWFADRFSKRDVAFYCKVLEVIAMLAGGYGIYTLQLNWILVMLFIMAAQSTLFSPALNGSIPELYPEFYVTKANSYIKLISTGAILVGIFCAGIVMDMRGGNEAEIPFLKIESIQKPEALIVKIQNGKSAMDLFLKSTIDFSKIQEVKENKSKIVFVELERISKTEGLKNFLKIEESATELEVQKLFREKLLKAYNIEIQYQVIWNLGKLIVSIMVILIAITGVIFAYNIKRFPAVAPDKPFPWLGPLDTVFNVLPKIYKDYLLRLTFFGYFLFYSVASLLTLIINQYGLIQLGLSYSWTSFLNLALLLGICAGSLIAGAKLSGKNWFEKMPHALLLMGVFLVAFYFVPILPEEFRVVASLIFLFFAGMGGGIFIIPSESFQQTRPDPKEKGEVIGAGNFVVFVGVLLSGFTFNFIVVNLELLPSKAIFGMGFAIVLISVIAFLAIKKVAPSEKGVVE